MIPNEMSQISTAYLITILFRLLIACEASGNNRFTSPVSRPCQELLLNGGMFGIRSDPALCRPIHVNGRNYVIPYIKYEGRLKNPDGSATRNLATTPKPRKTQNEPSPQASIHPCVQILESPSKSFN